MKFKEIMGAMMWTVVFCVIVFAIVLVLLAAVKSVGAQEEDPGWPAPDMFIYGYLEDWRHDTIQVFCDGQFIQEEPVWIETHGGWSGVVYGRLAAQVDDEDCQHGSAITFKVDNWPQMGEVLMEPGMGYFDLYPVPVSTQLHFPLVFKDG